MGRPVSKTGSRGFESLPTCFLQGCSSEAELQSYKLADVGSTPTAPILRPGGAAVYETAGRWFDSIRGNPRGRGQIGKAPALQAEECGFDSHRLHL